MKELQQEYEELLDSQDFDPAELDYTVADRHVEQLKRLAQVANCGITIFDMYRRRHIFASYNFSELFRYDLAGIAAEDSDYFNRRIHPDDLEPLHRNGVACTRYMFAHKDIAAQVKLINEYRILVGKRYVRVIEQFQVLEFDPSGNVWLSLSVLDVSPSQAPMEGVRSQLLNYKTGVVYPIPRPVKESDDSVLSQRETEVLQLIRKGMLSKEIADQLAISVHTVNTHRQRILEKLHADNSMEAVRYAAARGLLD